jgi:NAD(P)-dependent dehydrogenase (short-subunit alcohol dehydrogenase family)
MTRVAVVTGAGGGMGGACARVLAPETDALLLTDRDADSISGAAAELATMTKVATAAGDLRDPAFINELAARASELGSRHTLVHAAGLSPSMDGWRAILDVDLVASARLLDAFLPHVTPGSVAVCIASVSGHMGEFDTPMDAALDTPLADDFFARFCALAGDEPDAGLTYRFAKRGVIRLCARAAATWGALGGRVLSISPGLIDTPMGRLELQHQPIKEWLAEMTPIAATARGFDAPLPGRIDDIASTVAFLCSERASFISGCDVLVDGGLLAALQHQT